MVLNVQLHMFGTAVQIHYQRIRKVTFLCGHFGSFHGFLLCKSHVCKGIPLKCILAPSFAIWVAFPVSPLTFMSKDSWPLQSEWLVACVIRALIVLCLIYLPRVVESSRVPGGDSTTATTNKIQKPHRSCFWEAWLLHYRREAWSKIIFMWWVLSRDGEAGVSKVLQQTCCMPSAQTLGEKNQTLLTYFVSCSWLKTERTVLWEIHVRKVLLLFPDPSYIPGLNVLDRHMWMVGVTTPISLANHTSALGVQWTAWDPLYVFNPSYVTLTSSFYLCPFYSSFLFSL